MSIVDLRQLNSRQIEPLLAEEAQHWRDELRWDYRPSLELIKKFVDAKSLAGCVAMENGRALGYAFYVVEEHKGLIGGLYVSPQYPQLELARQLLVGHAGDSAGHSGNRADRSAIDSVRLRFRRRLWRARLPHLSAAVHAAGSGPGHPAQRRRCELRAWLLERWDDRQFAACARLIQLAYANHMDGEINDQYRSESGALKFLKNIVILPGCGQFLAQASFVLRAPHSHELVGVVLTSAVAPGIGHTTQICVMPGYQGHGLGRRLIDATIAALRERGYTALSLTVTSSNQNARASLRKDRVPEDQDVHRGSLAAGARHG